MSSYSCHHVSYSKRLTTPYLALLGQTYREVGAGQEEAGKAGVGDVAKRILATDETRKKTEEDKDCPLCIFSVFHP